MKTNSLFDLEDEQADFFCKVCEDEVEIKEDHYYCSTCKKELLREDTKDDISLEKLFGF